MVKWLPDPSQNPQVRGQLTFIQDLKLLVQYPAFFQSLQNKSLQAERKRKDFDPSTSKIIKCSDELSAIRHDTYFSVKKLTLFRSCLWTSHFVGMMQFCITLHFSKTTGKRIVKLGYSMHQDNLHWNQPLIFTWKG